MSKFIFLLDEIEDKVQFNKLIAARHQLVKNEFEKFLNQQKERLKEERTYEKKLLSSMNKKVGRNDKCPCGSGKKYKKCCSIKTDDRTK